MIQSAQLFGHYLEAANKILVITATTLFRLFMMVFLYFIYGNNKIRIADIDNGQ